MTGTSGFGSGFNVGPNLLCDSQPITTLTNDNTVLNTAIQSLYCQGRHQPDQRLYVGLAHVSPNGPFNTQTTATGAIGDQNAKAYASSGTTGSTTNVKVMILMTDGYNHWANISGDPNASAYSSLGFYANARLGTPTVKPTVR